MEDELKWVQEIREGSRDAFTRLVRLHQARIRAFMGAHVLDKSIVDDLAQEVFYSAYRTLETYRGDAPLGTWLLGIARNRVLAYLRAEGRRQRHNQALKSAIAESQALDLERQVPDQGNEERRAAALEACLKGLPGFSATLIDRFYFKGMTSRDLSRETGKQAGVLRMTLRRIRQALRRCVEERLAAQAGPL